MLTQQQARKWLLDRNFLELPANSYLHWIEKDWFERYKTVLTFKDGKWMPILSKLSELNNLDNAYKQYKMKEYMNEKELTQLQATL